MRDHDLRTVQRELWSIDADDPVCTAGLSAGSTRIGHGYADVSGVDFGVPDEDGIPVIVTLGFQQDPDSGEGWDVTVATPNNLIGETTYTRHYHDHFTATAVFEWLLANYGLDEGPPDWGDSDDGGEESAETDGSTESSPWPWR